MATRISHLQKQQQLAEVGVDTSTVDAQSALAALDDACDGAAEFRASLRQFLGLGSTLKEVTALKPLCKQVNDLAAAVEAAERAQRPGELRQALSTAVAAASCLSALLLAARSRALHKHLLATLGRLPACVQSPVMADLTWRVSRAAETSNSDLALADALSSIIAGQAQHPVLETVVAGAAAPAALALARGVIQLHERVAQPATVHDVECCHAALGVLYTLLTRHAVAHGAAAPAVLSAVLDACCMCLHNTAVSREATLTAAVVMVALLFFGTRDDAHAAHVLGDALFPELMDTTISHGDASTSVLVLHVLQPRGTSAQAVVRQCTPFARLCLLKGMLTSAPGASLGVPCTTHGAGLLVGAILPELCDVANGATCAHERYHAVSGCASAGVKLLSLQSKGATAQLPADVRRRLERLAWAGWEDPQPQVVRAVHILFDALLDLQGRSSPGTDTHQAALHAALTLLRCGPRKGRWAPLSSLVRRVRGHALLATHPALVDDVLAACGEDTVCAAAAAFLRVLADDLVSGWTLERGASQARADWVACVSPPLLRALLSVTEGRLRSNVGTFVLSPLLSQFPELGAHLLRALVQHYTQGDAHAPPTSARLDDVAAAVITLLRPARALGLSGSLGADILLSSPGGPVACAAPEALLLHGILHPASPVRLDGLELLCSCPRLTELPSPAEGRLLTAALSVALSGGPAPVRNRIAALLRRLLPRIAAGLARVAATPPGGGAGGGRSCSVAAPLPADTLLRVAASRDLVAALLRGALQGVYPGAPFERKYTSLDTVAAVMETWPPQACVGDSDAAWPYDTHTLSSAWAHALLASGVDSWDRIREKGAAVLTSHLAPLPGLASPADVSSLLHWMGALCRSPRVRESDSAARLLCMLVSKYVATLRWTLALPRAGHDTRELLASAPPAEGPAPTSAAALVSFLEGLVDVIDHDVACAEDNPAAAARTCFVHGPLLALRTCLPAMNLGDPSLAHDPGTEARAQAAIQRLLAALQRLTSQVVLATVARPEAIGAGAADVAHNTGDIGVGVWTGDSTDEEGSDGDGDGGDEPAADPAAGARAPRAQVLMTAAWLASKEVALTIGSLAWHAPSRVLPPRLLVVAGDQLVDMLLVTKHNGVVDKTRQGLAQLAARLLQQGGDTCADAPRGWTDALLDRLEEPGQGVRDLIRRSAGLPFALLALCCAEPPGMTRSLLPRVLRRCLAAAAKAVGLSAEELDYVPGVHAFNVLRVALADHDLAPDTAGALQPALACALDGFASPHWAVRNAAGLLFASLCGRVTGVLNPGKHAGGALRRVSTPDFFSRFPDMQGVLGKHLQPSAPALLPALALLSRLQPVDMGRGADASLVQDAGMLVPLVRAAAGVQHATIRAMSSRALVALVPPSTAAATAIAILSGMPSSPHKAPPCNAMHGDLMHALALLRTCAQPASPALSAQLERLQWLADPAACAAPAVRGQFLALLLTSVSCAAADDPGAVREASMMDAACDACDCIPVSQAPGDALWRKQAALCRVEVTLRRCAGCSSEGEARAYAAPLLNQLLVSTCYEARGALLKGLQRAPQARRQRLPAAALAEVLVAVVQSQPLVFKLATRALELLLLLPADSHALDWWTAHARFQAARDGRLRAAALRVFARVVGSNTDGDAHAQLVAAMEATGQATESDELRQASADALGLSRVLLRRDAHGLRGWVLCTTLLQDEDDAVRSLASEAVSAAAAPGGERHAHAALGQAVDHMGATFAREPLFHAWLLAQSAGDGTQLLAADSTSQALSRRLFIHEKDNQHAEELLVAQLCAHQLRSLASPPAQLSSQLLSDAGVKLRQAADGLAAALCCGSTWAVGGITCHEDIFTPLYRCLMTVWALAPALHGDTGETAAQLAPSVLALCRSVGGHSIVHPLVSGMIAATEQAFHPGSASGDAQATPLFLLRHLATR